MKHIAIAGSGLVGSLLALYLAKHHTKIDVFERRADMRLQTVDRGRSINLAMSYRGWRSLKEVGLEDAIRPIAIPMQGRMVHYLDGSTQLQPYSSEGECIYSVSRGDLNQILMSAADKIPNITTHFEQQCSHVNLKTGEITIKNTQTNDTTTQQYDLVFGADGAFSAVRASLQRTDRFNYSQNYIEHAYKELHIPPTEDGGWKMHKNALHIWPRKNFMLIALPNTDGSFTCTLFLAYKGDVSFEKLKTPTDVLQFWQQYFSDTIDLMPDLAHDFFANPTSSLVTVRCNPWVFDNKVALIGDAAHAIVPFYGQGMNAGFEDCHILNTIIDEYTEAGITEWDTVLQQYQHARIPDANAIADLALRNFIEMRDLVADPQFLFRKKVEKYLHEKHPEQYTPLYDMISFSYVRYSEALRIAQKQDEMFGKILAISDVEEKWNEGLLYHFVETLLHQYSEHFVVGSHQ